MPLEIAKLNNAAMLALAEDHELSTQDWAKIMFYTKSDRSFFDQSFTHFQKHRFTVEMSVKSAVVVTLAIGLCLTAPTTLLLGGAALTLTLSSLIFSKINLSEHSVAKSKKMDAEIENFNILGWEEYRTRWSNEARNHAFSAKQKALHINLNRVGMALVVSFAAFAAIISGAAVPIAVASVIFAGSLFHRGIDDPTPYLERDNEFPALTTTP